MQATPVISKVRSSRLALTGDARLQTTAVVAVVYALIVMLLWLPYNLRSGLGYETGFPYNSETTSWLRGFFYEDSLRIHTNTFYQLSYLLGEALGMGGSYVPYQIVYACLWWARGFLVYLIVRKFLPNHRFICYTAGALTLVHASDGALEWVGQLNQFGFIFWMLLAFYFLILAYNSVRSHVSMTLTIAACFCEYMSLWSYESQLLLVLTFPLSLLLLGRRPAIKWGTLAASWYFFPTLYGLRTLQKYALSRGATYQESVLRKTWSLSSILSDWTFNIVASLEFWNWPRGGWSGSEYLAIMVSVVAGLLFISGGICVLALSRAVDVPLPATRRNVWWVLLASGFVMLALSFPVYLLLDSARGLWRTQLLSGIGSGLLLTALLGVVSLSSRKRKLSIAFFLSLGALIVGFGTASAVQKGAFHRWIWERHRTTISGILSVAPSVKPNAIVILVNVPKSNDPFGHNMWFDLAVRLIYPGIPVSGLYFYADGTPAPGNNFVARGSRWEWDGTGLRPAVTNAPLANTVVVENSSGKGKLVPAMPGSICRGQCKVELYNPTRIITGHIAQRTLRRYFLPSPP